MLRQRLRVRTCLSALRNRRVSQELQSPGCPRAFKGGCLDAEPLTSREGSAWKRVRRAHARLCSLCPLERIPTALAW